MVLSRLIERALSRSMPDDSDSKGIYQLIVREIHPVLGKVKDAVNKLISTGPVDVRWYGAKCDGVTDDTVAVQAAIDDAFETGYEVFFPPGSTLVSTIGIYTGTSLIGSGHAGNNSNVPKSEILQISGTVAPLITRRSGTTGPVYNASIRKLELKGVNGTGNTGLYLNGFINCRFDNLFISSFRDAADAGCGVDMINTTDAGCFGNDFTNVTIADCDTGLRMDAIVAGNACGYNRFHGLTVYQEVDCIKLLKTGGADGSIYNTFSGVLIQGNNGGGRAVYCEGSSNTFTGVVIDNVTGQHYEFSSTSSANIVIGGLFDYTLVTNNQVGGAGNTIIGDVQFGGGAGGTFIMQNRINGDTVFSLRGFGATAVPEFHFGTDFSSQHFQIGTSGAVSGSYLRLRRVTVGDIQRWNSDGTSSFFDDVIFATNSIGPRLIDRTTGTSYRLYVDGGALLIEAV